MSLFASVDEAALAVENSKDYQLLKVVAKGKAERAMGKKEVIPAEPPVWAEVKRLANSLLTDPPHLSILIYLAKAETHLNGFGGLCESLDLIYEKLESSWDTLAPGPDSEDPDDPYYDRANYLSEITESSLFTKSLSALPLVDVRGIGRFSSADIEIATGQIPASEEEQQRCQEGLIVGAFNEADPSYLQSLRNSFVRIDELCELIQSFYNDRAGENNWIDCSPLRSRIKSCEQHFNNYASARLAELNVAQQIDATASDSMSSESSPQESSGDQAGNVKIDAILDRESVVRSLENIVVYFQTAEPSSPVPLLAHRALEMTQKNFFQVLDDLVPSHKGNLSLLLSTLQNNLLASILSDCYQRYTAGSFGPFVSDTPLDSSPIKSRQEVKGVLDAIDVYFTQNEPSSPVPMVVEEIRKIIPKRFPDLVEEFNRVLGPTTEQESK